MQRKRFLRDCQRIIQLQRVVRGWLNHRNDAATIIQRNVRRFLACRRRRKFAVGIVKFQVNTSFIFSFFSHGFWGGERCLLQLLNLSVKLQAKSASI